jgi:uncharacterized MAPEG superfamily protein
MELFSNYRTSVLAIPAYHFLILFPHAYAITIGRRAWSTGVWDNRNPRGAQTAEKLQKGLDADSLAAFERARACSANGFENLPLFAAAVVLGNAAGVDAGTMDTFALSVLGLRVFYTMAYLNSTTRARSGIRSLSWIAQVGLIWRMFFLSAKAFAAK